mmetsp:Transcript_1440/g.2571  ORF Transcript_1440/g.2571 Transcript_1440/m.2571 type:complete len:145 (-) Transcript_1440:9-443(-)
MAAATDEIQDIFRCFDVNSDGIILESELKEILQHLDGLFWDDERVATLFAGAHLTKDGRISLDDFINWLASSSDAWDNENPETTSLDLYHPGKYECRADDSTIDECGYIGLSLDEALIAYSEWSCCGSKDRMAPGCREVPIQVR